MLLNYISGLEEDCGNLSVNEVFTFAMKAACRCMNGRRAEMLRLISAQREPKTITSVVDDISRALGCPKSTVWANINFLKEFGLIQNGRGRPVSLTRLGRLVLGKVSGGCGTPNDSESEEGGLIMQAGMIIYGEAEDHAEAIEEQIG